MWLEMLENLMFTTGICLWYFVLGYVTLKIAMKVFEDGSLDEVGQIILIIFFPMMLLSLLGYLLINIVIFPFTLARKADVKRLERRIIAMRALQSKPRRRKKKRK